MIIRIKFSNTKFKIDKFKFLDLISLDFLGFGSGSE